MSDTKTKDTGVSLTDINNNYIRNDGSTPVSSSIDMQGNTLYNVSDPVNPQDVATKEYADKVGGGETAIIKTRYGSYGAIGNIDMRGYTLTNVLDPVDAQDVATKEYVDKTVSNVSDKKNTHIIVAHARYQGDLIKGTFPFAFGGVNRLEIFNAFLMPHSGYVRRFVLEDFGLKIYYSDNFINTIEKTYGFTVPVPYFTLVLIKTSGEMAELGTLYFTFAITSCIGPKINYGYFSYSPLPGVETYKINKNDILNIRSEFSTAKNENLKVFYFDRVVTYGNVPDERANKISWENIDYTYLATILIELDPL